MKKIVFLALVLTISATAISAPAVVGYGSTTASLQQAQPPLEPPEAAELYGKYFAEKDQPKRYQLAKEFLEKYPNVDPYWKKGPQTFIQRYDLNLIYVKCFDMDKIFFTTPNESNLTSFIAACDNWVTKAPTPDPYSATRLSLGTGFGVLAGFYKDTDRGFKYAEKALPLLAQATAPEKWKQADWDNFRKENTSRLTQYKGLFKLRQATPDNDAAIIFLTEAAGMKDGPAIKDPNTYLLRAEATTTLYTKLNAEYNALSDDDKRGPQGKELLGKIYPVVERMTNDYGRVMALTEGQAPLKGIYDDAKSQGEQYIQFLNKTFKIDDLVKRFKVDISATDVKIKTEESSATPPPGPKGKGAKATASAPTSGTTAPSTGAADKPAPKTPAKPAPKKRK